MTQLKLFIHVAGAKHFLRWEADYLRQYFDLQELPSKRTILLAFGPDALATGASLPALVRVAYLFPGFGYNPYHNVVHRYGMQRVIEEHYDLLFANPGPLTEVFAKSSNYV